MLQVYTLTPASTSRGSISFFTHSDKDAADQLFVFFCEDKNVSIKTMRKSVLSSIAAAHD